MKIGRRVILFGLGAATAEPALAAVLPRAPRPRLYDCEGCEAVGERPRDSMRASVDIAGPHEPGDRLVLTGTVRHSDAKTPADDIVIYAHHTNANGLYAGGTGTSPWSRRHGRLRAWARTGPDGLYRFNTIKPAPYPDLTMPAHIHLMVGEPGRRPYYIDDVVFEGEFRVDDAYRRVQEFRGGGGIVRLQKTEDGVWLARRDILLETHPE